MIISWNTLNSQVVFVKSFYLPFNFYLPPVLLPVPDRALFVNESMIRKINFTIPMKAPLMKK